MELVHAQLKRAKGRVDSQDEQLFQAVNLLLTSEADGIDGDRAVLQKLAEELHLQKETSWKQELKALEGRRSVVASRSEEQCLDHMMKVLKQIHPKVEDEKDAESVYDVWEAQKASSSKERDESPRIPPDDFKCPISLELMTDPVIVATGQVAPSPISVVSWALFCDPRRWPTIAMVFCFVAVC